MLAVLRGAGWALLSALLLLLASAVSAEHVYHDLLARATKDGHIDTFVQFRPLELSSGSMARVNHILQGRLVNLGEYAGVQQFDQSDPQDSAAALRGTRRQTVMEMLKRHADRVQAPVKQQLTGLGYEVESFWINNSILIRKAPLYVLTMLVGLVERREDGGENIISLSPNRVVAKVPPISGLVDKSTGDRFVSKLADMSAAPWNLRQIRVDKVWERTRGRNVVVANIDTGVYFLHHQLRKQYRGTGSDLKSVSHAYNWYDPENAAPFPRDVHGHGTHTIGTMVGENVGIAREAKWIAAQGCDTESCSQYRLLASAQWVMCPTDQKGENPRCDLGADIVNNSWGGEMSDEESMTWFSTTVDAWLAAGMIPIFAQGNSGPGCGTAGTPGDLQNVIGIGAVDRAGALTVFSSRGPGGARLGHAKFKPDFVAPGQGVVSCKPGGGLVAMSGTSMAAPHMAGVAALLLSLDGTLDFARLYKLVLSTAGTKSLREPQMGQRSCFGKAWDIFPNYHYGYGLVDAEAAADLLVSTMQH